MKQLIFPAFLVLFTSIGFAQQKSKPAAPVATPPKLAASLGKHPGGNVSAELLSMIVDSPIVVKDAKGVVYAVKSFTINYTFQSSFLDEETQQTKVFKDFRSYDFRDTNKLSEIWRESIKDNVKKNDEMLINNIIVAAKNGKSYVVPSIKFKVLL